MTRHHYVVLIPLTLLLCSCWSVDSDGDGQIGRSPSDEVTALFAALDAGEAEYATTLFDSLTVVRFQKGLQIQLAIMRSSGVSAAVGPMPGILTDEEIRDLPPDTILTRYLETLSVAYQRQRIAPRGVGELSDWRYERRVLGHVIEEDTLAHVVFQRYSSLPDRAFPPEPVQALTLVKRPEGWRVKDGDFERMGLGFFTQMVRSSEQFP